MTGNPDDTVPWRDFLYTMDVAVNAAIASFEADGAGGGTWTHGFDVTLLAAASPGSMALPAEEVLAEGSELGVTMKTLGPQLELKLQLQGFAALDTYGGRLARLISDNGAIDYRVRFTGGGQAVCQLSDAPKVRKGLERFAVFFESEPQPGPHSAS